MGQHADTPYFFPVALLSQSVRLLELGRYRIEGGCCNRRPTRLDSRDFPSIAGEQHANTYDRSVLSLPDFDLHDNVVELPPQQAS